MDFAFDNTYARLPARFFAQVSPTPVRAPSIVKVNRALSEQLGLDPDRLASADGAQVLAGNVLPPGAAPIALAYAGHQFGHFVPQLGDGRAILLGEIVDRAGKRFDIQLKGSGRTPFSRGGDGRAALGPVLREYIVSEAMAALGIPTTRSLAAVTTGETVLRDTVLPGAVLTRVAASHIRVGTFEFFAARGDVDALIALTSYAVRRHFPGAEGSSNDARALLDSVVAAQANLVARWLGVGFVHGVMNTDNTAITGETLDYGPCAFLDEYDPQKKFSSIDQSGRYAFANQPRIARWNLARFGETLLPLLADSEDDAVRLATESIQRFSTLFDSAHLGVLRAKLGLSQEEDGDLTLGQDLLHRMASNDVDYTVLFRRLCTAAGDLSEDGRIASLFAEPDAFHDWSRMWRQRLAREPLADEVRVAAMRRVNPALVPRNHRIAQAIDAAVQAGDLGPFETLVRALARPYEDNAELVHLADPPRPEERILETFCGT